MPSMSVVVVAQNEERTIGKVLSTVEALASEIILVDSGSTDKTIAIATECGAKVVHQDWLGYAAQKNFAIELASSDWILSLDADEVLSPELVEEIKLTLKSPNLERYDGYRMPRLLFIADRPIRHGGFYPDAQLRLIRKGKGKFNDRMVHEAIRVDGNVGMLTHDLYHYAYPDVAGFSLAMDKYARLSAEEFKKVGKTGWRVHPLNEMVHPLWTFVYRFVLRGGFLDGALGWQLNAIYSDYVRRKIRYLRAALRT